MASSSGTSLPPSLVRYDPAVLVSEANRRRLKGKGKGGTLPPVEAKAGGQSSTDDILSAILPPRTWTEGSQTWVQNVSSTPGTRLDVMNLQEMLDQQLKRRQARETGICPIREELYAQCFDEIIRQVTINCSERGLLLLRVRDEMRMTVDAYRTLYESAVAFGMRKALQAEQGKGKLRKQVDTLLEEKEELQKKVSELNARMEANARKEVERKREEDQAHAEEVAFLKKQNQQLKSQLEALSAPSK